MHRGRPTILVVNDDSETRVDFACWLSEAGHRPFTAGDATTAVFYTRRLAPDIVVIGLGRRLEGLELARRIRVERPDAALVLTAPPIHAPRAVPEGLGAVVASPTCAADLIEAIHHAAQMRPPASAAGQRRHDVALAVTRRQQQLASALAGAATPEEAHDRLRREFGRRVPPLFVRAERAAEMTRRLAAALYLPAETADQARGTALLHEIGKLTLPAPVLLGDEPLGDAELDALGNHHVRTLALLACAPALAPVKRLVPYVHARWDGSGVPLGLAGRDIPIGARIVAVADAFEATRRGDGEDFERARAALVRAAGSRLDPDLVQVCVYLTSGAEAPARRSLFV